MYIKCLNQLLNVVIFKKIEYFKKNIYMILILKIKCMHDHLNMSHINNLSIDQIFTISTNSNESENIINVIPNDDNDVNNYLESLNDYLDSFLNVNENLISVEENEFQNVNDSVTNDEENRKIPKCCICLTKNVNMFFNCGHVCSCKTCSLKVSSCPICRKNITIKQRLFF